MVTGYGLLNVTGDVHKQMRRFMNPAFSLSNLIAQTNLYYDPIYKLVSILQQSVEETGTEGKTVKMYPWISKMTLGL